ncbi:MULTISPECIES: iron ABC transporter substrate-binding protein [Mycolicibacterium]|jgi:iron(III) transport system substrate-binding protein|uniref:Iron ABC transporter substrate-binding protein n=2 Tax=Mycolicibacterium TaxID=1866885 RepID=A0A1X1TGI8_9MYCO|nr:MULTISPECIES: iron ABC transporter substrate-binding protein [Mycolicibacterium]MCV7270202.1 extracellular solute-binding protein [Mycolicibacterium doricum]MDA4102728.1 iron ABC transporter substrate-binding protein [Mycolicibacterium monacense DSM 44395]OBB75836.1 iron ABC transporter substrate-binding protein [Mycolicibacterium monacense]OBF53962.1 iron ABC transporter substrate-binding protein [Mycolicibacterium monacense]ORB16381.1 iron ABC transporter substrate-binding protein [Mycoli
MSTRRTRWNRIVTLIVAGGLAAGLTACSSSEEDGLLVYNAQHESLTKEWIDAFTKETGIKVTYRQGGDTELGNQLIAEGDASPADVFLTENSPAMAAVERDGLFTDVDEATIAQVPPQFRPATSKWTGVAARTTVFAYDKTKLTEAQLPTSIMDLEKPEWKGRWGAPPVKPDFQAIVAAMLELTGERATGQWLAGMKAGAEIYSDNIATLRAVNDGQVEGGIIYHYYWFRDQSQTKEISGNTALHYFRNQDPGAFVSISGGGILNSSKKKEDAQKFLTFITSNAGQEVLEKGTSFEYPVASGVPANPALVPLVDLQAPAVNPSNLDAQKVTDLMTKAGLL